MKQNLTVLVVALTLLAVGMCWTAPANDDKVAKLDGYMDFTGKF